MNLNPAARHEPAEHVAAGAVYLVLSAVFFIAWIWSDVALLALLALPTVVAGLVSLCVGWTRLRRERADEHARRGHGSRRSTSPPRSTGR